MDEYFVIEEKIRRIEARADLHGTNPAIEEEIRGLCRQLDEMDAGAGEEWLRNRDQELGRALQPPK